MHTHTHKRTNTHTRMYAPTHTHTRTHTHTCPLFLLRSAILRSLVNVQAHTHTYTRARTYAHTHTHTHTCPLFLLGRPSCTPWSTYKHIHTYTRARMYTRTHTHTYTHTHLSAVLVEVGHLAFLGLQHSLQGHHVLLQFLLLKPVRTKPIDNQPPVAMCRYLYT